MKLVFVHGRDQQGKDPNTLKAQWLGALENGLGSRGLSLPEQLTSALPFYGDELDRIAKQRAEAPSGGAVAKGPPSTPEELRFRGEMFQELAAASGISDDDVSSKLPEAPIEKGPLNFPWVQAILRALDEHTPFGADAISAFTHDVWIYLTVRQARKAVDAIVAAALPADEPCVIVAHSLGSVVAYNVLRQANPQPRVNRFVTVGSPLGVRTLKAKLDLPLSSPACVRDWKNARDPRDVIALHPLDDQWFPIASVIENRNDVDNFTSNRHGIAGYLSDVGVARWVFDALA